MRKAIILNELDMFKIEHGEQLIPPIMVNGVIFDIHQYVDWRCAGMLKKGYHYISKPMMINGVEVQVDISME